MAIKVYVVKVLNVWANHKRKKRARKFLEDESIEPGTARIKSYPVRRLTKEELEDQSINYRW